MTTTNTLFPAGMVVDVGDHGDGWSLSWPLGLLVFLLRSFDSWKNLHQKSFTEKKFISDRVFILSFAILSVVQRINSKIFWDKYVNKVIQQHPEKIKGKITKYHENILTLWYYFEIYQEILWIAFQNISTKYYVALISNIQITDFQSILPTHQGLTSRRLTLKRCSTD